MLIKGKDFLTNNFLKFRVIDGEYIVKISRVIIKHDRHDV